MVTSDKQKWDAIYRSKQQTEKIRNVTPAYILHEFQHLLPSQGKALDLASGFGANALFLAQHNLQISAWDISPVAIEKLDEVAQSLNLNINTEIRDIVSQPPEKETFDIIVVSHFLDRKIMPYIISALRENGLLFYQTFTKTRVQNTGPDNEKYRLDKNELLKLCEDLDIVIYREEALIGDTTAGFRNEALFIGQRKSNNISIPNV